MSCYGRWRSWRVAVFPGAFGGDNLELRATSARLDAVRAHSTSAYDSRYSGSFFIVIESSRLH